MRVRAHLSSCCLSFLFSFSFSNFADYSRILHCFFTFIHDSSFTKNSFVWLLIFINNQETLRLDDGKRIENEVSFPILFCTLFHLQILYSSLVWLFQSNNSNLLFRRHNNVYFFKNHPVSLSMDSLLLFLSNIYNYHPLTQFLFNL